MEDVLYDGLGGVMRTLLIGILPYPVLVALLRITGKRTLTKLMPSTSR